MNQWSLSECAESEMISVSCVLVACSAKSCCNEMIVGRRKASIFERTRFMLGREIISTFRSLQLSMVGDENSSIRDRVSGTVLSSSVK